MWCVAWLEDITLNIKAVGPFRSRDIAERVADNTQIAYELKHANDVENRPIVIFQVVRMDSIKEAIKDA